MDPYALPLRRRRLSNTFHIFKIEVGSSLRSFASLTMKLFCLFYPASTQDLLISKIWTIIVVVMES